jgi:hypothetical protein
MTSSVPLLSYTRTFGDWVIRDLTIPLSRFGDWVIRFGGFGGLSDSIWRFGDWVIR